MATITNTYLNATDNSSLEATIETCWTGDFILSELQRNKFLKELENAEREEYRLVIKRTSTEFGAKTTAAEAGVEDGDVISVVIRPKAGGDHKHYYDSDDELKEAFDNACRSGNMSVCIDEEDIHSVDDIFDAWKYDTFRSSHSDYNWSDDDDNDEDDD